MRSRDFSIAGIEEKLTTIRDDSKTKLIRNKSQAMLAEAIALLSGLRFAVSF